MTDRSNDGDFAIGRPASPDNVRAVARAIGMTLMEKGWASADAHGLAQTFLEIQWLAEVPYEPMTRAAHRKLDRALRGRRWWQR